MHYGGTPRLGRCFCFCVNDTFSLLCAEVCGHWGKKEGSAAADSSDRRGHALAPWRETGPGARTRGTPQLEKGGHFIPTGQKKRTLNYSTAGNQC